MHIPVPKPTACQSCFVHSSLLQGSKQCKAHPLALSCHVIATSQTHFRVLCFVYRHQDIVLRHFCYIGFQTSHQKPVSSRCLPNAPPQAAPRNALPQQTLLQKVASAHNVDPQMRPNVRHLSPGAMTSKMPNRNTVNLATTENQAQQKPQCDLAALSAAAEASHQRTTTPTSRKQSCNN